MKKLTKKAERVLRKLLPTMPETCGKIDNRPGTFMAVHVDRLWDAPKMGGTVFSVAHNYEQNGDLMSDPDMEFLVSDLGVFPLTYQQDGLGIRQSPVNWEDGKVVSYRAKQQADITRFANEWMGNIAQQQFRKVDARLSLENPEVLAAVVDGVARDLKGGA